MRALVTGATGLVGSNIALRLLSEGHEVVAQGRKGEQEIPAFNDMIHADLMDLNWKDVGSIDVLFHEAAITDTRITDHDEMFRVNVEAAKLLFANAVQYGAKHIVFASSTAVYGNAPAPYVEGKTPLVPLNVYAQSKKGLEEFAARFAAQHEDVVVVGLRYCNVYGPGEGHKGAMACIVSQLAQQMAKGNPRLFKFGEQKRDYIYVKDVVDANLLAAKAQESCVVNCGSGTAVSFNDAVSILNEVLGVNRVPEYIENPFEGRYQSFTQCDMALAKKVLGFSSKYDLREGMREYLKSGLLISG